MAPRWGVVARGGGGFGGGGVTRPTPKQKRRGKAPRRFDDLLLRQDYADFAMISSAILRGTGS